MRIGSVSRLKVETVAALWARAVPIGLLTGLLLSAPARAGAQPADETPGSELTVYLLTIGPGEAIWERFGHNAIVIRDERTGSEISYDYGRFDFDQDRFLLRFIRGEMLYWMEDDSASWVVYAYTRANRTITAQELALTPEQRLELQRFLRWNVQEENRYYAYDYYRDNCSTRVRDAIDLVLGGALRQQLQAVPAGTTYRTHTQRLTADAPAVNTGLLLALGQPTDQPLTAWEEGFIPMELAEHVRTVSVPDEASGRMPLVRAERVLYRSTAPPPPDAPPARIPAYLLAGLIVGGLLALLGWGGRGASGARTGLAAGALLLGFLYGLPGTLVVGLWAVTGHDFTYWNENVLQAHPLGLAIAIAVPLALRGSGAARVALALAMIAAGLSLSGALLQLVPGFDQRNGEIIALMLPIHLGLAAGVRWALPRRGRQRKEEG